MSKISGPLINQIDLHVEVAAVPFQELAAKATGTPSDHMREQVSFRGRKKRGEECELGSNFREVRTAVRHSAACLSAVVNSAAGGGEG